MTALLPGEESSLAPRRRPPFFIIVDHFDTTRGIAVWLASQVVMAQLMDANRMLATLFGLAAFGLCLAVSLSTKRLISALCAMAYIASFDTTYRMTSAKVPWEASKYMLTVIALITLYRFIGRPRSTFGLGIIILVLPSLVPVYLSRGLGYTRDRLSFVLMGAISLAVAAMVMRRLRMRWSELRIILIVMLGPTIGVTSIAFQATRGLSKSDFVSISSNVASSGGYGPNQVSAIIGVGLILSLFLLLEEELWSSRALFIGLGIWFFAQSMLTFSRGGLSNVVLAMILAAPHLLAHDRLGLRFIVMFSVFVLILGVAVLPRIDSFTGGSVDKRFQDRNTTLRSQLAEADLHVFTENPLLGAGAGASDLAHGAWIDPDHPYSEPIYIASHTEWTRLPAESGIFGILVIFCIFGLVFEAYQRQPTWLGRAWTVAMVGWAVMEWTHASTRNAVTGMVFALGMVAIDEGADDSVSEVAERSGAAAPAPLADRPIATRRPPGRRPSRAPLELG